jgi:two-component system, NtrC family, response regulator AtoC
VAVDEALHVGARDELARIDVRGAFVTKLRRDPFEAEPFVERAFVAERDLRLAGIEPVRLEPLAACGRTRDEILKVRRRSRSMDERRAEIVGRAGGDPDARAVGKAKAKGRFVACFDRCSAACCRFERALDGFGDDDEIDPGRDLLEAPKVTGEMRVSQVLLERPREPQPDVERHLRFGLLVALDRIEDFCLASLAEAFHFAEPAIACRRTEILDALDPERIVKNAQCVKPDPGHLGELEDALRQARAKRLEDVGGALLVELFDRVRERVADPGEVAKAPVADELVDRNLRRLERACASLERARLVAVRPLQLKQRCDLAQAPGDFRARHPARMHLPTPKTHLPSQADDLDRSGIVSGVPSSFTSDPTRSHLWDLPSTDAKLVVLWEGGSVVRPLNEGDTVVIGRGDECDVQVFHTSVSRKHVELHFASSPHVRDLGSSNGTQVGGVRLARGQGMPLGYGVAVRIGAAIAIVQPGAAQADPVPPVSCAMDQVWRMVQLVAPAMIPVLLLGETGVGKEVAATAIHQRSPRASHPLIRVNCAAFTEALLESELFGHERGAYTGAVSAKEGLLEQAHSGTLFLDEVGELPLGLQAKLLRVLEDREVRRVGATRARSIDVRFIAATNRDLPLEVQRGAFRGDLYFRLNGISIRIPPLRERGAEIIPLAQRFLGEACARAGVQPLPLSPALVSALTSYGWPGNVRELRNVIERAVLLAAGGPVEPRHLVFEESFSVGGRPSLAPASHPYVPSSSEPLPAEVERLERARIERALVESGGNQTMAAKALGITRRQLIGRIEAFGLPRPRKKGREET